MYEELTNPRTVSTKSGKSYPGMFLQEIQILESGGVLGSLFEACLSLVHRSLQIIFLVVLDIGGQQIVHHTYPDGLAHALILETSVELW